MGQVTKTATANKILSPAGRCCVSLVAKVKSAPPYPQLAELQAAGLAGVCRWRNQWLANANGKYYQVIEPAVNMQQPVWRRQVDERPGGGNRNDETHQPSTER